MTEVKLETTVKNKNEEKKHLYVIVNEKGDYLKNSGSYWTTDLNKCLSTLRGYDNQLARAKYLLQSKANYDLGKYKCLNKELYSFKQLFIQEVNIVEVKNADR